MTPDQKKMFEEYEEIKMAVSELEARADVLKPLLLQVIDKDQKAPVQNGYITVESRKTWKFSKEVDLLEMRVDEQKKAEKQLGIATEVDGAPFLKYYPNKKAK